MLYKKIIGQCGRGEFTVLACADTLARTPLGVRQYLNVYSFEQEQHEISERKLDSVKSKTQIETYTVNLRVY